ncbi:MAG TPA: cellulase family glycosylhydrolase, partial [Polyangiaceae bacterium]|nr:cellulase family glycosylhydrolase [Polyangiaceae bacterium]
NVQNYDGINQDPDAHAERLVALWSQIAESFHSYPDTLYFELLNEPHDKLTADKNNALILKLLTAIRESNPERAVIIDPAEWGNAPGLARLMLPAADRNLIPTFHYYDPHDFTHQGAPWEHREHQAPVDWPTKSYTQKAIAIAFDRALQWAEQQQRPLYLGEFGVYQAADMAARVRWTRAVVEEARARHLPYAYWELRSGFGAYDMEKAEWRTPLLDALVPKHAQPSASGPGALPVAAGGSS